MCQRRLIILFSSAARSVVSLLALGAWVATGWAGTGIQIGVAQSNESLWSEPTNLSRSGAASQPTVSVAPDGSVHTLWWDSIAGMQYSTSGITATTWSTPTVAPQLYGERRQTTDPLTGITSVALAPPGLLRLLADASDAVKVFWLDTTNVIRYSRLASGRWTAAKPLAQSAVTLDARRGMSDTVHLVYARSTEAKGTPSGIYYIAQTRDVAKTSLVYSSLYFRTANANDLRLSLATDDRQNIMVLWDDARFGSNYARSGDGGTTWSGPQAINGTAPGISVHPSVAVGPEGAFLLVWGEVGAGSCRIYQQRSLDGGQTWAPSEQILGSLTRCPDHLSFSTTSDGRLWLVGLTGETGIASITLAAWDGQQWSEPAEANLSYKTGSSASAQNLGCPGVALAGDTLAAIGCDDKRDIWVMRNATSLEQLVPILKSEWQVTGALSGVSADAEVDDLPALAMDRNGLGYGLWSQSSSAARQESSLNLSVFEYGTWQRGVEVLRSPVDEKVGGQSFSQAQQPSLTVEDGGKLHAVWTSGSAGAIYYSWARKADAPSAKGWSAPVALPIPATNANWPFIVADPRGSNLYTLFAVPNNEKRGIYLATSLDGGATWLTPTVVFDAVAAGWSGVTKPRLVLDASIDTLHLVWLRVDFLNDSAPRALFYMQSKDRGQTWSAPMQIASGLLDWPQVTLVSQGQIYIAWSQENTQAPTGAAAYEVWGRYSPDEGQRWSEPSVAMIDIDGPFGLASDNAGKMYLLAIGRRPSGESGLALVRWNGDGWDGDQQKIHGLGQTARSGNAAVSIIAGTRQLAILAQIWTAQPNNQQRYTIYGGSRDVEASTVVPAPTFTPVPVFTATPMPEVLTPTPVSTQRPQVTVSTARTSGQDGFLQSQPPLVLGGAAAVVLVSVALIAIGARRRLGR